MNAEGHLGGVSTPDGSTTLAHLVGRARIRSALAAYFDAVQQHDWDRVTGSFVPSAKLDYGTPGVEGVVENVELLRLGTERLTSASMLLGFHSDISVGDGVASSETGALTCHRPREGADDRARLSMVLYEDDWRLCEDAHWRITRRICHHQMRLWCRTDPVS
jgi:hypothetical protein